MPFTQTDLDAVNAALASGELTVRAADGKTVTYRTVDELLKARNLIVNELSMQSSGRTARGGAYRVKFSTLRGF